MQHRLVMDVFLLGPSTRLPDGARGFRAIYTPKWSEIEPLREYLANEVASPTSLLANAIVLDIRVVPERIGKVSRKAAMCVVGTITQATQRDDACARPAEIVVDAKSFQRSNHWGTCDLHFIDLADDFAQNPGIFTLDNGVQIAFDGEFPECRSAKAILGVTQSGALEIRDVKIVERKLSANTSLTLDAVVLSAAKRPDGFSEITAVHARGGLTASRDTAMALQNVAPAFDGVFVKVIMEHLPESPQMVPGVAVRINGMVQGVEAWNKRPEMTYVTVVDSHLDCVPSDKWENAFAVTSFSYAGATSVANGQCVVDDVCIRPENGKGPNGRDGRIRCGSTIYAEGMLRTEVSEAGPMLVVDHAVMAYGAERALLGASQ